jgi:hypothetical protein
MTAITGKGFLDLFSIIKSVLQYSDDNKFIYLSIVICVKVQNFYDINEFCSSLLGSDDLITRLIIYFFQISHNIYLKLHI